MGRSKSDNAMAAKAKAMFGNRLTPEDFQTLLQKRNMAEIASYLKNETYFAKALEGINEQAVHRGQLEELIRRDLFDRFSKLMRFAGSQTNGFYRYGIILNEIEQILACIRSFNTPDNYQMVSSMPLFIEKQTCFDIKELAKVTDFVGLIKVLEHTPYADIIRFHATGHTEDFDYTECEISLKRYYYEEVMRIIDREFSGQKKKEIKDVFLTEIELDNITKIYRYKRYFHASNEQIKKSLNPVYLRISEKELNAMIENTDADNFLEALSKSDYRNFIDQSQFVYIEYHTQRINYHLNKRHMMFTTNADLILVSYITLAEIEIQNLIDIIEGVRYGITQDKIRQLLIY